jgi:ketosteroid isomerase-like protein
MTREKGAGGQAADEIAAMLEQWADSVRRHDIAGVLRHHDPDLLFFDVVGPTSLSGLEPYRQTWEQQFFPWHGGTGRFELQGLNVWAGDRIAFATALLDCAGTENGQPVAFTLRLTIGLEKKGGAWTIVHEHHSEPLPFDNERIG